MPKKDAATRKTAVRGSRTGRPIMVLLDLLGRALGRHAPKGAFIHDQHRCERTGAHAGDGLERKESIGSALVFVNAEILLEPVNYDLRAVDVARRAVTHAHDVLAGRPVAVPETSPFGCAIVR